MATTIHAHNFKVGDTVFIINRTYSGEFFLEGKARIKRVLATEDRYRVQFIADNGKLAKQVHERFVDPAAQDDPYALINKLNRRAEES